MTAYKSPRTIPTQSRGKESVRVILAAASKLFEDHGASEVTTNDIAKAAGIPVGSVYRYFHNKGEIIEAVITAHMENITKVIGDIRTDTPLRMLSWYEIEVIVIQAIAGYIKQNKAQSYLHYYRSDPSVRESLAGERRKVWQEYAALIAYRSGRQTSERQIQEIATVTFSMLNAILDFLAEDAAQSGVDPDMIVSRAADAIGSYLRVELGE